MVALIYKIIRYNAALQLDAHFLYSENHTSICCDEETAITSADN